MLDWLVDHNTTINTLANVGMLIVWSFYLQVFLRGFRRQTHPKIVINRAAGSALDAACFVSNMSSDAIYLESVLVTVQRNGDEWTCAVTDMDKLEGKEQPTDPRQWTHQGPLGFGKYTSLGNFDAMIDRVFRMKDGPDYEALSEMDDPITVEVMIIADYASEDLLIGAKRRFKVECRKGAWYLYPETVKTKQIRSRRERHHIRDVIAQQA